ncbi:AI-2E family transporter [Patescibacteria group bacterium]|nr:AI-2E family transporter [Patescibacteria group bacterium]
MFDKHESTSISITTGTMFRVVFVALGALLIWTLRDFFLIILTSIVIASFVESAIPHFKKIGIGRVFAVVICYVSTILFLAGMFYLFAPLLITEIYNFSTFLSSYVPDSALLNYLHNEAFSGAKDVVANLSGGFSLVNLLATSKAFISNLSGGFFLTLSSAFGSIFNVALIIIMSFYLSIEEKGIENFLRIILPIEHEDYAVSLWNRARIKIALWIKGQLVLGLIDAVLVYLVLSLIGVQYALLLAIIAGVMGLVPYGTLISLVPAVSIAYLSGGISTSLIVAGAYLIIHQFELFLFTPLLIKNIVGLSPFVIILSAVAGFELSGVWGLVLGIPTAVFFMEFMNDIEKHKAKIRIK